MEKIMMKLFAVLSLTISFSMAEEQDVVTWLEDQLTLHSVKSSMLHLASANLNCAEDTDCQFKYIGARPCGPKNHLLVSRYNPHLHSIHALNERWIAIERKYSKDDVHICGTVFASVSYCDGGICRRK